MSIMEYVQKLNMPNYKIIKKLGVGAQGIAILIENTNTQDKYCLKVMNVKNQHTSQLIQRELNIISKLHHPNIIKCFSFQQVDRYFLIKMQLAEGGDFDDRCGEIRQEPLLLEYFVQMCVGLHYIHSKGIIHRDIKPANILVQHDKENNKTLLKLTDFGHSRQLVVEGEQASTVCGTPVYISPEVLMQMPYSTKADVFSLGVVLHRMIEKRFPFNALDVKRLQQLHKHAESLQIKNPRFSQELRDLCKHMLVRMPSERPSIEEILKQPILHDSLVSLSEYYIKTGYLKESETLQQFINSGNVQVSDK